VKTVSGRVVRYSLA